MGGKKILKVGDKIYCRGIVVKISEIIYQDVCAHEGEMDVEFVDSNGKYRHWKQYFDGGYVCGC